MLPRYYGGKIGEYMWEKEMERLERFKNRPWELQRRETSENPLFVLLIISIAMATGLMAFSLF